MATPYSKEQSTRHAAKEVKEKAKPKRIPKKSAKRKVADVEYKKLHIQFLKENTMCAVYPSKMATEVHHMRCGGDRDKYYLDTNTWLPVSREAHNWIHLFPKEARLLGFLY